MNAGYIAAGALLVLASTGTQAQQDESAAPQVYSRQPAYADVISSTPDYRQVKINVPRQQVCRDEPVVGASASNPSQKMPVDQTRCEIQYDAHLEQRQVGYDVTYRYAGQIYHTHLVRDPGAQLPIDVSVVPAASAGPSY